MIDSVLVPLDGSELAERALPYATPIASRHDVKLHLVFVIPNDAEAPVDDRAREYLATMSEKLGGDVETHVRLGRPADEIIECADELDNPLIVMTTHGRTGIGRWIYGSVADKVIHASDAPVLLLRSGTDLGTPKELKQILVPLDGSVYSETALATAKSMAKTFDAELCVTRVAETSNLYTMLGYEAYAPGAGEPMTDLVEQLVADTQKYIKGVVSELKDAGFTARGTVLEGFAGEQLLRYEKETEPDLIVMATHGRSGFQRFVFGSVAERVLKAGQTPVLMVKPSGNLDETE